ncbi:MAG: hypothetical protein ABIR26_03490 [Ramlibacter sp.]
MRKAAFLGLACLMLASGGLHAQARYSCRISNGSTVISDRPCPAASPGVVYYGPDASSQYRQEQPLARIGEAPPHVKYMSARCASLNDALRTANARGLNSGTMATMQKDYRSECGENEQEAQALYSQEKGAKVKQRRAEKEAEKLEVDRASLREQQCGESKRILFTKRSRIDLNEGEKAELQRFEANYRARCG